MMQTFDCAELIKGKQGSGYAHEYDSYLNFFALLGNYSERILCLRPPTCWCPFILYLGHEVKQPEDYRTAYFQENDLKEPLSRPFDCNVVLWTSLYEQMLDKRRAVEITSTSRPELVHALYLADTLWPCPLRLHSQFKEFPTTCNGSYFRDEIMEYRARLRSFVPVTKKRAILVPCAASKPYPSPLHRKIQYVIPNDKWHLIVATGVLGLVPEELWSVMPHYDSGLPNMPRCRDTVAWYFGTHSYEAVVVYSDFYAYAIRDGLRDCQFLGTSRFVLGDHYRDSYENLLLDEHLMKLARIVAEVDLQLDQPWERNLTERTLT